MTGGNEKITTPSIELPSAEEFRANWDRVRKAELEDARARRAELVQYLKELRETGVYKIKFHFEFIGTVDVEIASRVQTFEVPNPAHFQHVPVNELDNNDEVEQPAKDMPVVRGRDGLTAEEQVDLYGNVIDAVPRDDEE